MGYKFIGEEADDRAGVSVSSAGDVDGDGLDDLLISALSFNGSDVPDFAATYVVSAADLATLDAADGTVDGEILLSSIPSGANSYVLVSGLESTTPNATLVSEWGDFDGDGIDDFLIGSYTNSGFANSTFYVISGAELAAADGTFDPADGVADPFAAAVVENANSLAIFTSELGAHELQPIGDLDGDGLADLMLTMTNEDISNTSSYLVFGADMLDLVNPDDGNLVDWASFGLDGQFFLDDAVSYTFVDIAFFEPGFAVSTAGDIDGDGQDDFLISAPNAGTDPTNAGLVHVVDEDDLAAADAEDGTIDGQISLSNIQGQPGSYTITSGSPVAGVNFGYDVAGGDIDGDGIGDILISNPALAQVFLLNGAQLANADAADGTVDGSISATYIAGLAGSYSFTSTYSNDQTGLVVDIIDDTDGDGISDILIAVDNSAAPFYEFSEGLELVTEVYLISSADLADADLADGAADGQIALASVAGLTHSWQFLAEGISSPESFAVESAGDVDGDGLTDLIFGFPGNDTGGTDAGAAFLVTASELSFLDGEDGTADGSISLAEAAYCFAAGTRIAVPAGEVAVDALRPGDPVLCADGRIVPVLWVGRQTLDTPRARLLAGLVCICAGALGPGIPARDLHVTADHAMELDGFLINAGALVDGQSVRFVPFDDLPDPLILCHVETEAHEILLAEAAPSESFIDYAGRDAFDNYPDYLDRFGADRLIVENAMPRISTARLLPASLRGGSRRRTAHG